MEQTSNAAFLKEQQLTNGIIIRSTSDIVTVTFGNTGLVVEADIENRSHGTHWDFFFEPEGSLSHKKGEETKTILMFIYGFSALINWLNDPISFDQLHLNKPRHFVGTTNSRMNDFFKRLFGKSYRSESNGNKGGNVKYKYQLNLDEIMTNDSLMDKVHATAKYCERVGLCVDEFRYKK